MMKQVKRTNARRNHGLLEVAMADAALSSTAKCVLTVLLFRFKNDASGLCNPSYEAIARAVGRTRRAIVPAVQELKASGYITYAGTLGGSARNTNRFSFALDLAPVKDTAPQPVQNTSPVKELSPGVKKTAHEPLNNHHPFGVGGEGINAPARAPYGAAHFEGFWQQYPKQTGRKAAEVEFNRILQNGEATEDELVNGAIRYAAERGGQPERFTKDPANWLKGGHYADATRAIAVYEPEGRQTKSKVSLVEEALRAGGLLP